MGKNRSIDSRRTQDAVEYLYSLAKRKGYLAEVMRISGVANVKSLQWTYHFGRISEEQISGYVQALGVDRDFLTGAKELTSADKDSLEHILPNRSTTNVPPPDTHEPIDLMDSFTELIENVDVEELANIKLKLQILLKKAEIRELEFQICN